MNELSLSTLGVGQSACICAVRARTDLYRRLLDLGLIPGTKVICVAKSPAGDPAAYLIRGAVIALRSADAEGISVHTGGQTQPPRRAVPA